MKVWSKFSGERQQWEQRHSDLLIASGFSLLWHCGLARVDCPKKRHFINFRVYIFGVLGNDAPKMVIGFDFWLLSCRVKEWDCVVSASFFYRLKRRSWLNLPLSLLWTRGLSIATLCCFNHFGSLEERWVNSGHACEVRIGRVSTKIILFSLQLSSIFCAEKERVWCFFHSTKTMRRTVPLGSLSLPLTWYFGEYAIWEDGTSSLGNQMAISSHSERISVVDQVSSRDCCYVGH